MYYSVKKKGNVWYVRVPLRETEESVIKNLKYHIEYIKRRKEARLKYRKDMEALLNSLPTVYVWGKPYTLKLIQRKGKPEIEIKDEYLLMYVRSCTASTTILGCLKKWYRAILEEPAANLLKKWEAIMGVKADELTIRGTASSDGNCTIMRTRFVSDDDPGEKIIININPIIAKFDRDYLEYVVVHELAHIINREPTNKGHGPGFWGVVEKYLPDWKEMEKKRGNGEIYKSLP